MKKSFTSVLERFNSDLWHFHLMVPQDISDFYNAAKISRLQCFINGVETFQCALMPKGANQYFINVNKERRKKLNLQLGDQVEVILTADNSPYGLLCPKN
ncbi:MAG: DUF1905 domain-containing protein [Saprospiraceae bacterium]|nr:DUF1905 domain-containing protein [Saprospiraceae bacterium]